MRLGTEVALRGTVPSLELLSLGVHQGEARLDPGRGNANTALSRDHYPDLHFLQLKSVCGLGTHGFQYGVDLGVDSGQLGLDFVDGNVLVLQYSSLQERSKVFVE